MHTIDHCMYIYNNYRSLFIYVCGLIIVDKVCVVDLHWNVIMLVFHDYTPPPVLCGT
jgi:hypothetical protein